VIAFAVLLSPVTIHVHTHDLWVNDRLSGIGFRLIRNSMTAQIDSFDENCSLALLETFHADFCLWWN
jgi:hypothetical protein